MKRIYTHLGYDDYKALGESIATMLERETTHTSIGDDPDNSRFYHKSYSLPVGDDLVFEFHGPPVAGVDSTPDELDPQCPHPFNMVEVEGSSPESYYPYCRRCGRSGVSGTS